MNSAVEQGLKNFLASKLGATVQTVGEDDKISVMAFAVSGVLVSLHCNIANDSMPELSPWIVVGVRSIEHKAGNLHIGEVSFSIATPQNLEGLTESTHRAIVSALKAVLIPANADDLSAAILATANCEARSWFVEGTSDSLGKSRWQSETKLKLCLLEQA